MTELKTLKDCLKYPTIKGYKFTDGMAFPEDLKQEAIKWIKQLRLNDKKLIEELPKYNSVRNCLLVSTEISRADYFIVTAEYIKHFFNISEEDLE